MNLRSAWVGSARRTYTVGKGERFPEKALGLISEEGSPSTLKRSCGSEKQQGDGKEIAEVLMFKGSETTEQI